MPFIFAIFLILAGESFAQGLSRGEIQRVALSHKDQTRSCYETFAKANLGLGGRIRIEIKVSPDGHVESTRMGDNSFPDTNISICLEAKIRLWLFPAPLANQPTTFSYPFIFERSPVAPASYPADAVIQMYRGRAFNINNKGTEDIEALRLMSSNRLIKAKGGRCDKLSSLREKCTSLLPKDRIVCTALIDEPPVKPASPDWVMIEHPDSFRIESSIYYVAYWHLACDEMLKN